MMALTHTMMGVAAYVAAVTALPEALPLTALPFAAAGLGSLAPDLDHPNSWLGKRMAFISIPLSGNFGHRGLTHSLLAGVAVTFGLAWYLQSDHNLPWLVAFLLGYLGHLLGDWMTGGVPLLWPSKRRFRAPFAFQTGGVLERLFAISFGLVLAFLGWQLFLSGGMEALL